MGINTTVQPSVGFDGNLLILAGLRASFPDDLNDTAVSDLTAETAIDVTYALTASGWSESSSQDSVTDDRLTLDSVLANPGKVTEGLSVQYVFGSANDVADPLFIQGQEIVFAVRRAVPHAQPIAAGDKFDFLHVTCGVKQNDAPAANANFTRTQTMFPKDASIRDLAIAA